jgi:hypothetical protein
MKFPSYSLEEKVQVVLDSKMIYSMKMQLLLQFSMSWEKKIGVQMAQ